MSPTTEDPVSKISLQRLRTTSSFSQHEVAEAINELASKQGKSAGVTANTVSRWERGITRPSPLYRRLLAELYDVPVEQLDFDATEAVEDQLSGNPDGSTYGVERDLDSRVVDSRSEWLRTRHCLNTQRPVLAQSAGQAYVPAVQVANTGLIAPLGWILDEPIDLAGVQISYEPDPSPPQLNGSEPESDHVRPLATLVRRYHRYTQAIRDIDRPRLFENRPCWRLLDVISNPARVKMRFGPTTYFAGIDFHEAVAHEVAYVLMTEDGSLARREPAMRDLRFRRFIGDPFNFSRRPVLLATGTLMMRLDKGKASVVLHRRNARNVAVAGGMLQVIPSGIFQPSSMMPLALAEDFDLWRNVMREYSEELLGNPEHDGDGPPMSYSGEPFASLEEARRDGRIRVFYLGLGLDALTLFAEVLTVAVIEAETFDQMASDFVEANDEGSVVDTLLPFDEMKIRELIDGRRIAPAGAGCLHLAWEHRDLLL